MMKLTKTKTEITFEKRERTTIRLRPQSAVWCDECAAEVLMLSPVQAAALARSTARDIFRRVEAGELHFIETADGALFVCRNSLKLPNNDVRKEITSCKPRIYF